ncbi:hypothetical protein NPIL_400401 [Nephila pilipes]|uniref:BTB domain-containing protein n=1 Tax=Nephila pilipes TaxID=299642 RepID=A0A8X6TCF3_NEPPI|nr:hypothetical protein NPIL_400401 [Nephila pilipes]
MEFEDFATMTYNVAQKEKWKVNMDFLISGTSSVDEDEEPSHVGVDEPTVDEENSTDYLLQTQLRKLGPEEESRYVEAREFADISKIYDKRKLIEDLISETDKEMGHLHTLKYESVIKHFATVNDQTIAQEFPTKCGKPSLWKIELLYEKVFDIVQTFRLTVHLRRRQIKDAPTKVNLTVSIDSDKGVELAYINFEGIMYSEDEFPIMAMSTEKEMDLIPDTAKYRIVLKVSGCCGQNYSCPEFWLTSKMPRNKCELNDFQKHMEFAKHIKSCSNVELECGVDTFSVNDFMLRSRASLFKVISLPPEDQPKTSSSKSVKLIERYASMPGAMNEFLKYLYSGACSDLSVKNAMFLYTFAEEHELGGLKYICKRTLISDITVSNFGDVFKFNSRHPDSELREALLKYAGKHKEEIKYLLQSDENLRDEELLEVVGEMSISAAG